MTQPLVSILLPHLRNPSNDAALRVCLDCLVANTGLNYELIVESVEERRDIYSVLNQMAERANSEWLVFWNTDCFAAPGWLEPLYNLRDIHTIVSPVMVECGAIPVNDRNLERNFGRTPETFRRAEFEAWAQAGGDWKPDWQELEESWYFPSLISRYSFNFLRGFDTHLGSFPTEPVDIYFWDKWRASGRKFRRVRSFIFHLQAYNEPERGVRA